MIRVFIRSSVKTGDISFKIKGHAMTAPKGEDLVCSAASAYVHQLREVIEALDRNGWLEKKAKIQVDEGKANITCKPKAGYRSNVEYIYMMTTTGFDWLQKEYPEYVKLN